MKAYLTNVTAMLPRCWNCRRYSFVCTARHLAKDIRAMLYGAAIGAVIGSLAALVSNWVGTFQ